MSFLPTIEQARDFLLLRPPDSPPDLAARDVLQAAHDRQAEWRAKCEDRKSPARLKEGAARKLRELAPMLPVLEIEVDFDDLRRAIDDPRSGRNQTLRLCDNVAKKIGALPGNEEKEMLGCRVEDLREAARNKAGSVPPLPVPPPPPPPPPPAPPPPPPRPQPAPSPAPAAPPPPPPPPPPELPRPAVQMPPKPAAPVSRENGFQKPAPIPPAPPPTDFTPAPFPLPKTPPSPPPSPPPKPASPPPPGVKKPDTGTILKLVPSAGAVVTGLKPVPLHFVARPNFVIGRFSAEGASRANFSCPLTEKRVSRAHVTLSRKGEEILIQDGDGKAKSSNGSKIDDETLTLAAVPASFTRERTIALGGIFTLTAQHLPGEAPSGPTIPGDPASNLDGRTTVIALVSGCMRFAAKSGALPPAQVVWLFTDASLGNAPANAVPLPNASLAEKHARVHFWQNGFWLENLRSGTAIAITESPPPEVDCTMVIRARPLNKGDVVRLRTGDTLKLGQIDYIVTIEP